jgi:hypothetical protein
VLTMHGVPTEEFHVAPSGRLVDDQARVVPVLHQYDRHPSLRAQLQTVLSLPPIAA